MRCCPTSRNKESAVIVGWSCFLLGAAAVGIPSIWDTVADSYSDVFHSIAGNTIATRIVASVAGGLMGYAVGSTVTALVKQHAANKRFARVPAYEPFAVNSNQGSEGSSSDGEKTPLVDTSKGKEEVDHSYQNAPTFKA